ncbi:uncharacterized protein L3040_003882 [Drepanopeziza brunnea f. sp. 'multigermtubi']|uniref:Sucrose transporter n=1 Tax=Marssonina brunnea f. sp. multigermtubi (strain MB_m1) TaxID=1072389 RepID=K1WR79_MARBU|nr:sucrose transporter [Drepanopeziza brunnea f. sp. 'multigermtubi' MB_m1]EKD14902.1 sucrose transporter [Drepanopeziza brunnea f. sp. 'multigermtubi' MB_m1]KAJ5046646.1 hypothetical protein L3040_003882 [Drepanopeziza brunnea f. sp. 'multigermtubi']
MEKSVALESARQCAAQDHGSSSSLDTGQSRASCSHGRLREGEAEMRTPLYLIYLTVSIGGLQVIWTTIMSQGSPYLTSLGLPSPIIALVWLAQLSGAFVQPYIGILSDSCENRWGRRRPFIILGTVLTIICTIGLPWTPDCVAFLFSLFDGNSREWRSSELLATQILASMWIWALNISIQPVQSGIRALIIDSVSLPQQVQASAYASCVIGFGSILGYSTAFVDLPLLLPWLGDTQMKGVCVIASVALGSTVALSCLTIKERKLDAASFPKHSSGLLGRLRELFANFRIFPSKILKIFAVQFFAWLSWFPFMFYITTYIGDIYGVKFQVQTPSTALPAPSSSSVTCESTRYGTLALVFFATMALLTNLTLPHFIISSATESEDYLTFAQKSQYQVLNRIRTLYRRFKTSWLTLPRLWAASHIFRFVILLSTAFTDSLLISTLLVATLGISWAITQWVPHALISAEIAKSQTYIPASQQILSQGSASTEYRPPSAEDDDAADELDGMLGNAEKAEMDDGRDEPKAVLQAGAVMGMQNMAIATPQMAAAVLCSLLFWILGRYGITGSEAAGWVIRILQLSGLVAAWLASQIETDG